MLSLHRGYKITKSGILQKGTQMAPKNLPKSTQNPPKSAPGAVPKNTGKKLPESPENDLPGPPKRSPKSTKNRPKTVSGPPGGFAGALWPEKVVPEGGTPPKSPENRQKSHNPEQKTTAPKTETQTGGTRHGHTARHAVPETARDRTRTPPKMTRI